MRSVNSKIDGVTGEESNPISTSDRNSKRVYFGDRAEYVVPDPGHSFQAIYEQVFGVSWSDATGELPPTMEGFAQQAESIETGMSETVMNGYRPEALGVYEKLVSEFAVCDRWFASLPASTQPNRLYVHSATSHGAIGNDTTKLIKGFPQKTIFESLDEAALSFGIYYQFPPSTLFFRNLRKWKYLKKFHQFDVHFKKHCKEGKLPNYVVVEQRYFNLKLLPGNDDHPPHDVLEGQNFVKEVYEALRASPQWNEILFIITYDEHGGFYDHVPTPVTEVPSPDDIVGPEPYNFRFDRLGVRVPTIMISPWIDPKTVLGKPSGPYPSSQFEHSSIPATVKKIFKLRDFLTKRDEWAGTFEGVLSRKTPRPDCPVTLPDPIRLPEVAAKEDWPDPIRLREVEAKEEAKLSEYQEELVQMAAVLKGDHIKDTYPHKLVENMKVLEAFQYVRDAFKNFLDNCEKDEINGAHESDILF